MNQRLLWLFLKELNRQCRFTLLAAKDAQAFMQNPDGSRKPTDMTRFWFAMQGFLGAVGNISKNPLDPRQFGGARTSSPLFARSSRWLVPGTTDIQKYHFEHFDERLEARLKEVSNQGFADSCLVPTNEFGELDQTHYLRNYATDTQILWFRGDSYSLVPILQAVEILLENISQELENVQPC
jgi:hypothetical protein